MDNLLKYLIRWNREMQKRGLQRWCEKNMFNKTKEVPARVLYSSYIPVESIPVLGGEMDINVTVAWK